MNRRDFLKLLGVGTAALAVEPVRKMWFVPSNAPVGSRVERWTNADGSPVWPIRVGSTDITFNAPDESEPWFYEWPSEGSGREHADAIAKCLDDPRTFGADPGALGMSSGHGPLTFRSDHSPSEWFYREPSDKSYSFTLDARRQEERDLHENPLWRVYKQHSQEVAEILLPRTRRDG